MLVEIVKLIEDERSRQDVKHGGKVMDSKRTAGDWAHYVHKQALVLHDVQTADQFKKQATKIAALGVAMLELVCRDSPADHTYEAKPIVIDKLGMWRSRFGRVVEITKLYHVGDFPVRGVEKGVGSFSWTRYGGFLLENPHELDLVEYIGPVQGGTK